MGVYERRNGLEKVDQPLLFSVPKYNGRRGREGGIP